jgi:L-alanine-DL-glutamate epimerase-like enolase superfamily enzyme
MKITAIRDITVPIRSEIRNAWISFSEMTASAVAIHTDALRDGKPVVGYGFNSNGRYAQSGILRERMIPRLLNAPAGALLDEKTGMLDPFRAWQVMMTNEKPGGHGDRSVAVGILDMALWDLLAKLEGKPLYRLLGERYRNGEVDESVYVYAAGGYYHPGKDVPALLDEIRSYLNLGYLTVKIKIGGASLAEDLKRIEAVLGLLKSGQDLAVDANGRLDLATALQYAEALNDYPLKWFEEPCEPLDFEVLGQVAAASKNPIGTGENLFSVGDSLNLVRYGGLSRERDYLQMDPALSYGLVEYLRILDMLQRHQWSPRRCIPHGGHLMGLHLSAGLGLHGNESYPGVFQPFGGFADANKVENGRVRLPQAPGLGIECKSNLYQIYRDL